MSNGHGLTEIAVQSAFATVDIYGDGWEFHGPAHLAWRIQTYASRLVGAAATMQTPMRNAVQFHALGEEGGRLAISIMDDEWRCGNEPRHWPHPHWTDQLLELAQMLILCRRSLSNARLHSV